MLRAYNFNDFDIFIFNTLYYLKKYFTFAPLFAGVAELVDVLDLGSSALWRGGSSPFARTKPPTFLFVESVGGCF